MKLKTEHSEVTSRARAAQGLVEVGQALAADGDMRFSLGEERLTLPVPGDVIGDIRDKAG